MESLISVYILSEYEFARIKLNPPAKRILWGGGKKMKFDIFNGVHLHCC